MSLLTFKAFRNLACVAGLFAGLSACGSDIGEGAEQLGETISCAIGEGVEISDVCTIERVVNEGVTTFLLHHPDGGFRRIAFAPATQELGVVDGADSLRIEGESSDDITAFSIGIDRYRVPSAFLRANGE